MAGLEDLAALLTLGKDQEAAIAAEDPYADIAGIGNALSGVVMGAQDAPLGQRIALGLLTGLGTGLGTGLSKDYQSRAKSAYQDVLIKSLAGQNVEKPSVLSKDLFGKAKQQSQLFNLIAGLKEADAQREFNAARTGKYQDLLTSQGWVVGPDGKMTYSPILDPAEQAKAIEKAKLAGESEFYGSDPSKNPNNPLVKAARGLESDTYGRITKLPSYVQFSDIEPNFKTIIALAKEDSRPASIGMISALARIWDPGGTVREGEYAINSQAQSALDSIVGDWRELILGKGKLKPKGKTAIIDAAAQKYNEFGSKYDADREALYKALEAQGGSRANIPTPEFNKYDPGTYTIQELSNAGYTSADIEALRAQGKVR